MSTSNNPQTLFRFVSLRNPKLAETKESNLGFIHRPVRMEGVFDQVVQSSTNSKFQALLVEATNFESISIKSITDLENLGFGNLLKIGKSIASQVELSSNDLNLCKDYYLKFTSNNDAIKQLWENLIYQFISQKDFYIKESITQIIKALHMGYVQTLTLEEELKRINGNDLIEKGKNAIIVIPKKIFEDDTNLSSVAKKSSNENLSNRENIFLAVASEKNLTEQNNAFERDNFINLKIELDTIQKKYNTSYNREYKSSFEKYNSVNSKNINATKRQLELIQELEKNKASDEELNKAYDELNKYEVPSFEFNFKNALNWEDLYKNLPIELFGWFLNYFSDADADDFKNIDYSNSEIKIISDKELSINGNSIFFTDENYNEIFEKINNKIQKLSKDLLNQVALEQDKFANIGGVLIPISNVNSQVTNLSYVFKAFKPSSVFLANTNLGYASLQVQVENSSWSVSHALISAETNLGTQIESFNNIEVIDNKINLSQFLKNKFKDIGSISIQLFFNNGKETTLELNKIAINTDLTGLLLFNTTSGNTNKTSSKGDDNSTTKKHFGLKRLGVAEYLKVVQTIHAYVPGEVSNIENVMASELRHKSVNELTRTENTVTTEKSQEVEKISDTTKTDRAEMQNEVAKEIDRQQSFQAHANFSYDTKVYKLDLGTSYASNNAQHTSNMQAVTKSKEITERAMERVQSKISEQRIMKIIQEVSLTNVHEFDNRGSLLGKNGPQHITGVYRWVDKKMKNQIYNYGLRTMFEFMIPEPAKLHQLAHQTVDTLVAPIDPRKAPAPHNMPNATSSDKALLEYWASVYGVTLTEEPKNKEQIFKAEGSPQTEGSGLFFNQDFEITENYIGKSATLDWYYIKQRNKDRRGRSTTATFTFSDLKNGSYTQSHQYGWDNSGKVYPSNLNLTDTINYQVSGENIGERFSITITLSCEPNSTLVNAWLLENFNAIIAAYQSVYDEYKAERAKLDAEQKAKESEQDSQANFYRIIESDVLKHNCIAYLLQDYLTTLGQEFATGDQMLNFKVILNDNLDQYTALAKFLEQAFEWSIKDYTFYPYYWADRNEWQKMYLTENTDPLFRSFLQAGMARVIVTVKPGFEEAVQYFLTTGQVWFGGDTPVIGDPLYMSIAQEMKEPTGKPQGNYWITRIPTTLTILQSKSTGLDVVDPLPIFPESHPENCENPDELEKESVFKLDDVQMITNGKPTTLPTNIVNP